MQTNKTIVGARIEGDVYDALESIKVRHRLHRDSTALKYAIKVCAQLDNILDNRQQEIEPNLVTALDRLSKLEKAALILAIKEKHPDLWEMVSEK